LYTSTVAARPFYIVDAFSDRPFGGNPAVVVTEADGLSDAAMRALAAELRMEAGFVLPPTAGGDLRLRFFSAGGELDLSGHVTIAAYAALAAAGRLPSGPLVRQESRAGVLEVALEADDAAAPWVTLDVGRPRFGAALERKEVADALRVGDAALAPGLAPRVVTCGVPIGVAGMADPPALQAATPDLVRLAALSRRRGILGLALFAQPGLHPRSALTARFFFPAVGPDEDVVSGAAVAAICAYGVRERLLTCVGEATFQTDQGHALGRPTRAHVSVRTEGGQLANLKVRGRGAVSAQGTFQPAE
jgi:PhzF family phenazine biosynthesis protein